MSAKAVVSEKFREFVRLCYRLTALGLECGPHMTRYSMYKRLTELGAQLQPLGGEMLCVSHSTHMPPLMGVKPTRVREANYPQSLITALPFADGEFDMVFSDQVLEHVEADPFAAIEETRRVLKLGGLAVHTTVFMYPVHGAPGDFWRFTPDALRYLCRNFSQVIEAAGWGSFNSWKWAMRGLQFVPVPHAKWHPLHKIATVNEPSWPMVTWVVARK